MCICNSTVDQVTEDRLEAVGRGPHCTNRSVKVHCLLSGSVVHRQFDCLCTVYDIGALIRLTKPPKAFNYHEDSPTSEPELTLDRCYFVRVSKVKSTASKYRVADLQSDRKTRMTGRADRDDCRNTRLTRTSRETRKTRKSRETRRVSGRACGRSLTITSSSSSSSFSYCFLHFITNGSSLRNLT